MATGLLRVPHAAGKGTASTLGSLSLISGTHTVEGKNWIIQIVLTVHTHKDSFKRRGVS